MMLRRITLLTLLILTPCKGIVQSDTHSFMVIPSKKELLIVDRKTNKQTRVPVGKSPKEAVLHRDFCFVISTGSDILNIINHKTRRLHKIVDLNPNPLSIVFNEDYGYIIHEGTQALSVFYLPTLKILYTLPLKTVPTALVVHNKKGYLINTQGNSVSVLTCAPHKISRTLTVGYHPKDMLILGNRGFVLSESTGVLTALDLDTDSILWSLPLGTSLNSLAYHEGYLYALAPSRHSLIKINPECPGTFGSHILLPPNVISFTLVNGFACLLTNTARAVIIDIKTGIEIDSTSTTGHSPRVVIHKTIIYLFTTDGIYTGCSEKGAWLNFCQHPNLNPKGIEFTDAFIYAQGNLLRPTYPAVESFIPEHLAYYKDVLMQMDLKRRPPIPLPTTAYQDILTPEETYAILEGISGPYSLDLIKQLYQPEAFLRTPAGVKIRDYLLTQLLEVLWLCKTDLAYTYIDSLRLFDDAFTNYLFDKEG